VTEAGTPWIDLSHIISCLNKVHCTWASFKNLFGLTFFKIISHFKASCRWQVNSVDLTDGYFSPVLDENNVFTKLIFKTFMDILNKLSTLILNLEFRNIA